MLDETGNPNLMYLFYYYTIFSIRFQDLIYFIYLIYLIK